MKKLFKNEKTFAFQMLKTRAMQESLCKCAYQKGWNYIMIKPNYTWNTQKRRCLRYIWI